MRRRILMLLVFCFFGGGAAHGQAVLFDGVTQETYRPTFLIAPVVVTGDNYSMFGRLTFRPVPRLNVFVQGGGEFNGGATAVPGLGWAGTLIRQQDGSPLNFGFFNSFTFPLRAGGPDAFITLAPVVSHSFGGEDRSVTPYAGFTGILAVNGSGSAANALLGFKVAPIGPRWNFAAELQAGQRSQFAAGLFYRF